MYIVTRTDDDMTDTIIGIFATEDDARDVVEAERQYACRWESGGDLCYIGDDTSTWRIRFAQIGVNVRHRPHMLEPVYEIRGIYD